ncbi:MAG TPA: DUF4342 domain-containing protein [Dehalococcoidales bacterium]|nr:DUF4342 domain-containing protein [Dehalococcoidales bacterium]
MATEKFTISNKELVEKVRQLIHEGNVRNIRIIHKERIILEIPLTVGVGAVALTVILAPFLAALGGLAALMTEYTIEVEKTDDKKTM